MGKTAESSRAWRVLIAEDEYFIAQDLARALAGLGAVVLGPVASRAEALSLVQRAERMDAAVLDINLQGEGAFAVADALVERGVPFMFATGYDQAVLPERLRHVCRWEKPFVPERLAASLIDLIFKGAA